MVQANESSDRLQISRDEYHRLMMINTRDELKSELVSWAKMQGWIIILVLTLIGAFGVSFVIESMVRDEVETKVSEEVKDARRAAVAARIETENAREALASLVEEREQATSDLAALRQSVKEMLEDAEEIQANFAAIDADINNVRALSKNIQGDISLILDQGSIVKNTELQKKREKTAQFDRNSQYSVLVFYRAKRIKDAQRIKEELITLGYRSSATQTDLSEAIGKHDDREIWLIYTSRGEAVREYVASILGTLGFSDRVEVNPKSSKLRNGDAQILLF